MISIFSSAFMVDGGGDGGDDSVVGVLKNGERERAKCGMGKARGDS